MDVRLGDLRNAQALLFRGGDVLLDVAIGVDDERLPGALAPDQIAGLRERGLIKALYEHDDPFWLRL